ncbi:unnamed protein product [Blepharisma stoltei]|uniref:Uncharacterized protein n=1 Tax=Blepharisma stoltei TaxID=1481888 RepID=A0AAU9K5W2_9CILI|nr:unnamed protein product [Blepharisma stoltei]
MDIGVNTESFELPCLQTANISLPNFKKNKVRLVSMNKTSKNINLNLLSPPYRKKEMGKNLDFETKLCLANKNYAINSVKNKDLEAKLKKFQIKQFFEKTLSGSLKKIRRKGNIDSACLSPTNNKLCKYLDILTRKKLGKSTSSGALPSLVGSKKFLKHLEPTQAKGRVEKSDTCALELTYDTYISHKFV